MDVGGRGVGIIDDLRMFSLRSAAGLDDHRPRVRLMCHPAAMPCFAAAGADISSAGPTGTREGSRDDRLSARGRYARTGAPCPPVGRGANAPRCRQAWWRLSVCWAGCLAPSGNRRDPPLRRSGLIAPPAPPATSPLQWKNRGLPLSGHWAIALTGAGIGLVNRHKRFLALALSHRVHPVAGDVAGALMPP